MEDNEFDKLKDKQLDISFTNDEIKAFPGGKLIFNTLVKLKLCKE